MFAINSRDGDEWDPLSPKESVDGARGICECQVGNHLYFYYLVTELQHFIISERNTPQ